MTRVNNLIGWLFVLLMINITLYSIDYMYQNPVYNNNGDLGGGYIENAFSVITGVNNLGIIQSNHQSMKSEDSDEMLLGRGTPDANVFDLFDTLLNLAGALVVMAALTGIAFAGSASVLASMGGNFGIWGLIFSAPIFMMTIKVVIKLLAGANRVD